MKATKKDLHESGRVLSKEEFINKIKTDDEFAKKWGSLGPVYGKQWRSWGTREWVHLSATDERPEMDALMPAYIDQIANSINLLKTDPDSRRNKVSAWNVGELDEMVLPPCHYGFQVYTRELSIEERCNIANFAPFDDRFPDGNGFKWDEHTINIAEDWLKQHHPNLPTRAISLMWNQRSVDTPLGLPFNIASYGLLLEIIAKAVNMVPDELIGNLGDTHIYLNQIEGVKEQIGRDLTLKERFELWEQLPDRDVMDFPIGPLTDGQYHDVLNQLGVPTTTRNPYPLSTLNINTEFWPTQSGECGVGELTDNIDFLIKEMRIEDFQIENYQSHPAIKMPLSN